jgi:hypothetical protein
MNHLFQSPSKEVLELVEELKQLVVLPPRLNKNKFQNMRDWAFYSRVYNELEGNKPLVCETPKEIPAISKNSNLFDLLKSIAEKDHTSLKKYVRNLSQEQQALIIDMLSAKEKKSIEERLCVKQQAVSQFKFGISKDYRILVEALKILMDKLIQLHELGAVNDNLTDR